MSTPLTNLEGMSFDSSLFEALDKSVSATEYKARLIDLLKPILDKRFPGDRIKRQIRPHTDRITFSCPYCGDSMEISWKQRGNIILLGKHKNYFKCFNCGTFKRVDHFFKDFEINLELDVLNYISDTQGNFNTTAFGRYDISLLLDVNSIEGYAIDRQELKNRFSLIEVQESPVWSWLNKRLQFKTEPFLYSPLKNYLLILNLTQNKKILGFQKRNFGKGQTKYLTYTLPTIYKLLAKTGEIPEQVESLSQLFGICFLDFNRPITLFEGPFDSFLFKNSVANGGANKRFPLEIPIRYFYDDDKTGKQNSIKRIEEGNSVFLWNRFKNDVGLPPRKKWDLNDVFIWSKETNTKIPMLENYFSQDSFDMFDI